MKDMDDIIIKMVENEDDYDTILKEISPFFSNDKDEANEYLTRKLNFIQVDDHLEKSGFKQIKRNQKHSE